ncbi:gliding motility-associated C-terminal domain-containing protein [Flavobacterium sp.]|uniref:T9SS type B sorting domain-containing protein n=1 Tax=Flavobacterium sp. TaxID=239 RepID=UPI0039E429EF
MQYRLLVLFLLICNFGSGQTVSLYDQFYGFYDYTIIGNTLNTFENGAFMPCSILTGASATLNLPAGTTVEKAYLYWAGSGSGDFDVTLNGTDISAQRTFSVVQTSSQLPYFSAFYDATDIVLAQGNGLYQLSNLDLTAVIAPYCPLGGNFAGWALVVVYADTAAPSNQINIYDGLQAMPSQIDFTLTNFDLDIINNDNASIAFVAWEGDQQLHNNESVRINGQLVGNPPLNPVSNAFNGTNSFTNATNFYNMDIDAYSLANFVSIGDTSADIQLTSDQDFVMISTVVTRFNSRYIDATIALDPVQQACDSRVVSVNYTVTNASPTDVLPMGTSIAIYINDILFGTTLTTAAIVPLGEAVQTVGIDFSAMAGQDFSIRFVVDDNGLGQGTVEETIETNNEAIVNVSLGVTPEFNALANMSQCLQANAQAVFDLSAHAADVVVNPGDVVSFYTNMADAQNGENPISNTQNFATTVGMHPVFVRIANQHCAAITSFEVEARVCIPVVPNVISPNNDQLNETLLIAGLRESFPNFKLEIYNRWGRQVWSGDKNAEDWSGQTNVGAVLYGDTLPAGTYFYWLDLNDPTYPRPLNGWVYLMR